MTAKKIAYALARIKTCKQNGYQIEALIKSYHLNIELVKYILSTVVSIHSLKDKKTKQLVSELLEHVDGDTELKTLINKKSIKSLKLWLSKMDLFFKTLKLKLPPNVKTLQQETEKIFGILNISANKLFVKS